ncbi:hypothetical protein BG011_008890 [Mortierella polycephala]|uniref:Auxin efflux carrier n=1 Tax=Mortierella polycephala TaxID=41804 RepID=A0A9P6U730_9FUNG|nr:hypothetical protein BG011_008890 [Mortierella polycephala]
MDWFILAGAAAEAVSQVLVVVGCGVVLSRTGYLSQPAQKAISKVNLYFMTPCLLFTKIASTISWTQFKAFWPIPVFYALFSSFSWIVAKVGSRLLGFSKDEEKFVIASTLFSNTNSLPMALLQSLAFSAAGDRLLRDETDTRADVAARGISYILFYAIFGNLVRWSYGFSLLVPKDEVTVATELPTPSVVINIDRPISTCSDASMLTLPHTPSKSPIASRCPYSHSSLAPEGSTARSPTMSTESVTQSVLWQAASTAYERIRLVLTPPLLTALLALVVGLVPALHQFFMSPQSVFYRFLVRPIEGCGEAAIPMILLCLGAQVVHFGSSTSSSSSVDATNSSPQQQKHASLNTFDPSSTAPVAQESYPSGLGVYTITPDESSSDEEGTLARAPSTRSYSQDSYGTGIATQRSNASSSVTLFHFSNSQHSSDSDESDNESLPLLGSSTATLDKTTSESHYRVRWITPVSFILFARMILVPVVCMPAILFHPSSMPAVLTMDPTFTLTLVLLVAAPTAINMIQICQIKGFFEQSMASVLFWSYCVFGIPTVLGWSLAGLWAAGRK